MFWCWNQERSSWALELRRLLGCAKAIKPKARSATSKRPAWFILSMSQGVVVVPSSI